MIMYLIYRFSTGFPTLRKKLKIAVHRIVSQEENFPNRDINIPHLNVSINQQIFMSTENKKLILEFSDRMKLCLWKKYGILLATKFSF
jgi:hypothetical protein